VRDDHLRGELLQALARKSGKDREAALRRFAKEHPVYRDIHHVRVTEPLNAVKIHDKQGRVYKGYKGDANYRYDVWRMPNGKWTGKVVTMFEAHQAAAGEGQEWRPHPAAKRVIRLHRNDMVALEHPDDGYGIYRVVKMRVDGQLTLAKHNEAGDLKRRHSASNDEDPFKYLAKAAGTLQKMKMRQIRIDETGRVWDPGPRQ
jgi:CRISPR-associated endonuclease Csn1